MARILTEALGVAIRDFIEDRAFCNLKPDETGELEEAGDWSEVVMVDATDANNLVVFLDNGQQFRISIYAEG